MFKTILQEIKHYDRIIIHRHSKPDGDAMGSQIGLKHIIKTNFPQKEVYVVGDTTARFSFMDDADMDEITDDTYKGALAILLDSGASALISDTRYTLAEKTIRFDHHIFAEKFADIELVDTSYESCCGLIADFAMQCDLRLDTIAAKSLFTGMVTDSGRFRYDATTTRTFKLAGFLLEQPFDMNEIYNNLYADEFESKKIRAEFTLKIRFTEHNTAYIYNTLEDVAQTGLDTFSVSRGMVNVMADIKGVNIWVNFTETETGVLCELRSNNYNINPIAVKYGGGGHMKASGATIADRATAMLMLKDLDELQVKDHE